MGISTRAATLRRVIKLDSHHAIERFGVLVGVVVLTGLMVLTGSAVSAFRADADLVSTTALYTTTFETSKSAIKGTVDGVYRNTAGDKALVMMRFGTQAQMSMQAEDYRAFLLGSTQKLGSEPVTTPGVRGELHLLGSTGYAAVLLSADEPFQRQVLNLTMRSLAELAVGDGAGDTLGADDSFRRFDQWRIFFNPGASGAEIIPALDTVPFDPARAFYDIAIKDQEDIARAALDRKLLEMRADLMQIAAYARDVDTTKVDGLFLQTPASPASIAADQVRGESAAESDHDTSTLVLDTPHVVNGGFDVDWRSGNVYHGYLRDLVVPGQTYVEYLAAKRAEGSDTSLREIADMEWRLSDGTSLVTDHQSTQDVAMRPLWTVMNNLSGAYQSYARNKSAYQSDLLLELLALDIEVRSVEANVSTHPGDFLRVVGSHE